MLLGKYFCSLWFLTCAFSLGLSAAQFNIENVGKEPVAVQYLEKVAGNPDKWTHWVDLAVGQRLLLDTGFIYRTVSGRGVVVSELDATGNIQTGWNVAVTPPPPVPPRPIDTTFVSKTKGIVHLYEEKASGYKFIGSIPPGATTNFSISSNSIVSAWEGQTLHDQRRVSSYLTDPIVIKPWKVNDEPDAFRAYYFPLVDAFSESSYPSVTYSGAFFTDPKSKKSVPKPGETFQTGKIGKFLGEGSMSTVYASDTAPDKYVYKWVALDNPKKEITVADQQLGRRILSDIKAAARGEGIDCPYHVTENYESFVVNGQGKKWFVSKEENIASAIKDANGRDIPSKGLATDALKRCKERGFYPTQAEEFTISYVVRTLNQFGIVWTDNKLQNLDIVRDPTSVTGYRVIFFDFDGFRVVNGSDRMSRWKIARALQKGFDLPGDSKTGTITDDMISGFLKQVRAEGVYVPRNCFDLTVSKGRYFGTLTTTQANRRPGYVTLNILKAPEFEAQVGKFNAKNKTKVRYRPPGANSPPLPALPPLP